MTPVLRAEQVSKSFGPIEVLSDVSLSLEAGEVHAVIGENGAGKSTLMRILSGHLPPTKGTLHFDGAPADFAGPVEAEHKGIVLVHQELLLAEDLTVAQNLFLGREIRRRGFVDDAAMRERAAAALSELGARIPRTGRCGGSPSRIASSSRSPARFSCRTGWWCSTSRPRC
jgi:ribose transport system ATP-binding protein